jgi:hypothetical protein
MQTRFLKGKGGLWPIFRRISIDQCTDDNIGNGSLAGYIKEAMTMNGPPICHAFIMVGKSFDIPAILFYQASNSKNARVSF